MQGCNNTEVKEPQVYEGPLREFQDIESLYTESDHVKIKLQAALIYEHATGDREFPKGIYLEFFDEEGNLQSTLKANHAYYFKEQDLWRGQGKVEVKNIQKNEQLTTEELFWNPAEKKIYTEKFVTIEKQGDIIYGEGLEANQDMTEYEIKSPKGRIQVNE